MDSPLVSCIMPTHEKVWDFIPIAIKYFIDQDYENKELIIVADGSNLKFNDYLTLYPFAYMQIRVIFVSGMSLGEMRNEACRQSNGEVVQHWDTDDRYANDWISKSVSHLLKIGADMTGLSSCYFYKPNTDLYLYNHDIGTNRKPYVVGASMCYKRSFWEAHPFQDRNMGEDLGITQECTNLIPHDYINGFTAILHGNNTCSHLALGAAEFSKVPIERIRDIMGTDIEKYTDI